jgi:hypothetical protein
MKIIIFIFGFWTISGRTWPRDPFKRVGLEKWCRNHPKLTQESNSKAVRYYRSLSIGKSMPLKTGVWRGKKSAKILRKRGSRRPRRQPDLPGGSRRVLGNRWFSGPRWGTTSATLRLPRWRSQNRPRCGLDRPPSNPSTTQRIGPIGAL